MNWTDQKVITVPDTLCFLYALEIPLWVAIQDFPRLHLEGERDKIPHYRIRSKSYPVDDLNPLEVLCYCHRLTAGLRYVKIQGEKM